VEAHQRRWSVRLFGLIAPDQGGEDPDQAKYLTLDFIQDILCIDGVTLADVDCAQRVGAVVDGKQTMLVRFFSRDLAQHIISNKRNLKETPYILHEDSTLKSRKLLRSLPDHPRIESAWIAYGSVWGTPVNNGKRIKFQLGDNIDKKIDEEFCPAPPRRTQRKPRSKKPPNIQDTPAKTPIKRHISFLIKTPTEPQVTAAGIHATVLQTQTSPLTIQHSTPAASILNQNPPPATTQDPDATLVKTPRRQLPNPTPLKTTKAAPSTNEAPSGSSTTDV
jgi:hypothetical protein